METSLHKQLKEQFRLSDSVVEYKLGRFRIDVVNEGRIVEIQQSGLAAIRDKVNQLLSEGYLVEVVKPLIARKRIIKLDQQDGNEVHRRWSPKRANELSIFDELIYFTRVFPHPHLKLIVPLVEIEEVRYPGHGRRRRWRKDDFIVADRRLVKMVSMQTYDGSLDLHRLLPAKLASPFDSKELAAAMGISRFDAQRIGYVLRKTESAHQVGKRGNSILYELAKSEPDCEVTTPKLIELESLSVKPKPPKRKKAKPASTSKSAKKSTKPKTARKKTTAKKAAKKTPRKKKRRSKAA